MIIYTDGSCLKNKNGGWSFYVVGEGILRGGSQSDTTNNRMELKAVIHALRWSANQTQQVIIKSDSLLVVNCASGKWKRRKNLDLWGEYDLVSCQNVTFEWVKAHNGNIFNEIVDKEARRYARLI